MMLKGKIEKGVPFPTHTGQSSTFFADLIGYLDKLEVGDLVFFQAEEYGAYKLSTRMRIPVKVYGIITNKNFTFKLDCEKYTVKIWRIR